MPKNDLNFIALALHDSSARTCQIWKLNRNYAKLNISVIALRVWCNKKIKTWLHYGALRAFTDAFPPA